MIQVKYLSRVQSIFTAMFDVNILYNKKKENYKVKIKIWLLIL